jgi:CRP/FNR family transcriptional regulator, cyclic AMP receptor protein
MDVKKLQTGSVRSFLVANTFIGSLPVDAVDALMKAGHVRCYPKGAPLFERGDPADSLLLIMSGRVKIRNITTDGREVVLNFLGGGDIIGEIASLDCGVRTASAKAYQDTQIFQLYRRDLLPVLTQQPAALLEIVQLLCERLRTISRLVEDNLRDMRGRFAAGILRLATQHGRRTPRGIEIDLAVNQRDLGNYLGLARENVNRQINRLVSDGVIRIGDGVLIIVNESALAALTGPANEHV